MIDEKVFSCRLFWTRSSNLIFQVAFNTVFKFQNFSLAEKLIWNIKFMSTTHIDSAKAVILYSYFRTFRDIIELLEQLMQIHQ